MGKRGPAPKPTAIKKLLGNPGQRKLNEREPVPGFGAPECPTWIDREAKAEWKRIVPLLDDVGILCKVDRGELTAYCIAWSQMKRCEQIVQAEGDVIPGSTGTLVANPAARLLHSASLRVQKFAADYGLNPSARTRLESPVGPSEADDVDAQEDREMFGVVG